MSMTTPCHSIFTISQINEAIGHLKSDSMLSYAPPKANGDLEREYIMF